LSRETFQKLSRNGAFVTIAILQQRSRRCRAAFAGPDEATEEIASLTWPT
jgi:hypothetical protein